MLGKRQTIAAILGNLCVLAASAAAAKVATKVVTINDATGSDAARQAVKLCNDVAPVDGAQAAADPGAVKKLDQALTLAERAVQADARDAKAHFAVFCSLGRKAEVEGADLQGLASLGRMREELDRALEIEPAFVDALVAKGRLLARLPWMLGGDADEGERLIRRAAQLDPSSPVPPLHLAHVLIDQGQEAEARELAHDAIPRAEKSPEPAIRAEAKQLEARLE